MSDPCLTQDCMPESSLAGWYRFKWAVLGLLGLLAVLLLMNPGCRGINLIEAPTLTVPSGEQDPGLIALAGLGTAGAAVEILRDGQVIGETTVGDNGEWSYSTELNDPGAYTFTARSAGTDGTLRESDTRMVGIAGGPIRTERVTVSRPEPTQLQLIRPTLDLPDGATQDSITLTGRGTPGSTVEIFNNGVSIGTATVGDNGAWSFDTTTDRYANNYRVRGTSPAGADLGFSPTKRLLIGGALTAFGMGSVPQFGEFAADEDGNQNATWTWGGLGEPGATVQIYNGESQIGSTQIGDDGTWTYEGDVSLAPGEYVWRGSMFLFGQNLGDEELTISIPEIAMAEAEEEEAPAEEATEEEETAEEPAEEEASTDVGVVVTDVSADTPTIGTVGFGMTGTGLPGTSVVVLNDGIPVGGARVLDDGTWACECTLPPGEYTLVVQEDGNPDNVSDEVVFVVENLTPIFTPPVAAPGQVVEKITCEGTPPFGEIVGTTYVIAQCEYMSLIADRLGTTVEDILAYNPQLTSARAIWAGQVLNIPSDAGCFDVHEEG